MSDVVALRPEPSTKLVRMITELLGRAQRGEIEQIALVYTEPQSEKYGCWISDRDGEGGSTLKIIGAIADLQWTALNRHNQHQRRIPE